MHLTGMMSCLNFRFIGTFFHHTICPFESISFEFDRNHHHGPKAGKFGYYKLWSIPVVTMPYVTKVMSQGLSLVGYSLPGNFMNIQFHLQHFDLHRCNLFKKICHQIKDGRGYLFAYVCLYVCIIQNSIVTSLTRGAPQRHKRHILHTSPWNLNMTKTTT